jgi:hypothetical protein
MRRPNVVMCMLCLVAMSLYSLGFNGFTISHFSSVRVGIGAPEQVFIACAVLGFYHFNRLLTVREFYYRAVAYIPSAQEVKAAGHSGSVVSSSCRFAGADRGGDDEARPA